MSGAELVQLEFSTDSGLGERARLGVIVLESDHTLEAELRAPNIDGVDHYVSRIANDSTITPDSLTAMEQRLPVAAALLPVELRLDAIGYGCTSAATLIGEAGIEAALNSAHPGVPCTNPITAAAAAFTALGVSRISVVTPYTADVTDRIVRHLESAGLEVVAVGSFLEPDDHVVARITEGAVADGAAIVAGADGCEGVFVSCTSLRTFGVLADLEKRLGKPVVSSNLAFTWHLLRLAGVDDQVPGLGRLFDVGIDRGDG
ncbi:MAG: Asp/Glu racemase [Actinobacteria bacterium]|nr:Asp/Glu racemase [Actinomycetota bacterium]MBT3687678.1 Asp/Glu racemase [Actinomycetota bacterium]MBT4036940.1 Asp/Glu racemase [Actinomycetota bacterium]MBT4279189.1 Asp/Glu racemase [Actinomycetota bacterium]MBT5041844.1 Asp/Glu racemase [Actinomycetota bacterium]